MRGGCLASRLLSKKRKTKCKGNALRSCSQKEIHGLPDVPGRRMPSELALAGPQTRETAHHWAEEEEE
jgi:hypothetical protein